MKKHRFVTLCAAAASILLLSCQELEDTFASLQGTWHLTSVSIENQRDKELLVTYDVTDDNMFISFTDDEVLAYQYAAPSRSSYLYNETLQLLTIDKSLFRFYSYDWRIANFGGNTYKIATRTRDKLVLNEEYFTSTDGSAPIRSCYAFELEE